MGTAATTTVIPPQELQASVDFQGTEDTALWKFMCWQRLVSTVATDGIWIANCKDGVNVHSVAHVIPARGSIHLFCRDALNENCVQAALQVLRQVAEYVIENSKDKEKEMKLSFSALDRRLVARFHAFLQEHYDQVQQSHNHECGMWIHHGASPPLVGQVIPSNAKLRSLTQADAELVDCRWTYRSGTSIAMVQKMIANGGCKGLEVDGELIAWVCQYLDGPLGMLWTEEDHRGRGYAALVVQEATKQPKIDPQQPWIACNVDSNSASRSVFSKLKWERVEDADWVGFSLKRNL